MRIGYWTYGYERTPLEEAVPQIASIGYEGIELCIQSGYSSPIETLDASRLRALKRLLNENNLEVAAVDAHWGLIVTDPSAWPERRSRFQRSIEVAEALGAPIVELSAGGVPTGWERNQAWDALIRAAEEVVRLAESRGIRLALEAHVGAVVESPEDAVALVRRIDDKTLRLNLDFVHPFVLGYSLERIVELLGPYACFAHVSDAHGRYPDHRFSTPGEGDVDWKKYVRLLQTSGYAGYLMVQIPGMRRRVEGYDPWESARRAYTTLKRALEG